MLRKIADTILKWHGDKTSLELHRKIRELYTDKRKLRNKLYREKQNTTLLTNQLKRVTNKLENAQQIITKQEKRIQNVIKKSREATLLMDHVKDIYENSPTQRKRLEQLEDLDKYRMSILDEINKSKNKNKDLDVDKKETVKPPKPLTT